MLLFPSIMNLYSFRGTHWLYFKDVEVKFICHQMHVFAHCAVPKLSLVEKCNSHSRWLIKSLPNAPRG